MEPYNPQQCGVIERKNMAIVDTTEAMVLDLDLCVLFWEKARNTIVLTS